jgi:SprT protein
MRWTFFVLKIRMKNKKIDSFFDHFPPKVAEYCFQLWHDYSFNFIVSKSRDSKLGDYRFSPAKGHQVTVNHNLNPYAFLVTYIHEVAHLTTYLAHKNKVLPHGQEWKSQFYVLFEPILDEELLPAELVKVLSAYLKNPAASSTGYQPLVDILKTFDMESPAGIPVHELAEGTAFQLKNLSFIKGKLRRTRYICKEINSGRNYLIAKNAHVLPIDIS